MDTIHKLASDPIFWVGCVLLVVGIALVITITKRLSSYLSRSPRRRPVVRRVNPAAGAQTPPQVAPRTPVRNPVARAGGSSGAFGSFVWAVIFLGVIAALVYSQQRWHWMGIHDHTPPTRSSAAGRYAEQDYPSVLKIPKGGTVTMPASDSDVWSDPVTIPLRLRICRDPEHGNGSEDVQCHDRHDAPGVWRDFSEEACQQGDQERYRSKGKKQSLSYFFVPAHEHC